MLLHAVGESGDFAREVRQPRGVAIGVHFFSFFGGPSCRTAVCAVRVCIWRMLI